MDKQPILTIYKIIHISAAHQLHLPYQSKCNNLHGHNWKIETWITGTLNEQKMVVDFNLVKKEVMKLDHIFINNVEGIEEPTAESIAIYLATQIMDLAPNILKVKVRVWETVNSYAEFEKIR